MTTECFLDVLRNTLMVTSFVLVIMLFIEVLNISTQGLWTKRLSRSPFRQVLLGAVLGMIPGCFGGFAAVSLFTHGMIGYGALMAAMITCMGDEVFVMLVQMPKITLLLYGVLFAMAVLIGWLFSFLKKTPQIPIHPQHFVIHEHESETLSDMLKHWKDNLKNPSFARALLMAALLLFIVFLALGGFEHHHELPDKLPESLAEPLSTPAHGHVHLPVEEAWFNSIFLVLALAVLVTVVCVSDHFIEHHLWQHVIKQHFLKIFLWTFAALLAIHFISSWVDALEWMNKNPFLLLLMAVLVGLIPESGPHLIFISLYLSGTIPFAVLFANALVQDGHSTLPLLAESKKHFLLLKISKALLGLFLGWIAL